MQLISQPMTDLMNAQIGHEIAASLQYLEIAAYCDGAGLPVMTQHFFKQAEEERGHAIKFVRYMLDADGKVAVPAIPAPRATFATAEEAVTLALEWEHAVTGQIKSLLDLAAKERDHLAHDFLEWFAREQLEECASTDMLLKMVRRAGEAGLMLVETALASGRAPAPISDAAERA